MKIKTIDLFCGIGGLTYGLKKVGIDVVAGYDIDQLCEFSYTKNNNVPFHARDIKSVDGKEISDLLHDSDVRILVGCAPCQPFSKMRMKLGNINSHDPKYDLLSEFGRLVLDTLPDIISMENVPYIMHTEVYQDFRKLLLSNGYKVTENLVYCPDYGISQSRRRFILLGSRYGDIHLIPPTHRRNEVTLANVIGHLPHIDAGETSVTDNLHRAAQLSSLNKLRIQSSTPGGTWEDWPEELLSDCHKKQTGKTYKSVYGRLRWDQIGPTITTQFTGYGTGRHGHPEQNRTLSLREGALLQTFPMNYVFNRKNDTYSIKEISRQIGNAVPVRLGEVIGISIMNHVIAHRGK